MLQFTRQQLKKRLKLCRPKIKAKKTVLRKGDGLSVHVSGWGVHECQPSAVSGSHTSTTIKKKKKSCVVAFIFIPNILPHSENKAIYSQPFPGDTGSGSVSRMLASPFGH